MMITLKCLSIVKSTRLVLLCTLLCCSTVVNAQERKHLEDKIANSSVTIYKPKKIAVIQRNNEKVIRGYVFDKITKEPIPEVNVFIANTLVGATTNIDGFFQFRWSRSGSYELIVSHTTYNDRVLRRNSSGSSKDIVIELVENVNKLNEAVETASNKHWKKMLKRFVMEFLGTTPNSSRCKILNPEVLSFHYDEEKDLLTAHSDELLTVINDALGYTVDYLLIDFTYQEGKVKYISKAKFVELEDSNKIKEKRWRKARENAYLGSLNHFLKTLTEGNLNEEGYKIFLSTSLEESRIKTPISPNKLYTDYDSIIILEFENYLEVVYKDLESRRYHQFVSNQQSGYNYNTTREGEKFIYRRETTILEINPSHGYAIIENGKTIDSESLIKHGYWGWKRNADLLPINYTPDE